MHPGSEKHAFFDILFREDPGHSIDRLHQDPDLFLHAAAGGSFIGEAFGAYGTFLILKENTPAFFGLIHTDPVLVVPADLV